MLDKEAALRIAAVESAKKAAEDERDTLASQLNETKTGAQLG